MILRRLSQSLKQAAALDRGHMILAAGGALTAALAVAAGLATARSGPAEATQAARRIAEASGGEISAAGLKRLTSDMDPAMLKLASRFDPARAAAPQSLIFQPVDGLEARRINGAIPFTHEPVAPAAPFHLMARSSAERSRAVRCLANAIYYEAALEPLDGQRAVAQVVVNRLRDPNFPKSVCGVVYEGWERLTGCQFSFTCDGALVRAPIPTLWNQARRVAEAALSGYVQKDVGSATHYHADYVAPYWAPGLVKITQLGAHIFYRWPGDAGLPAALTAAYRGGELRLSEAVLTGRAPRALAEPAAADPAWIKTVQTVDPATGETRTRVHATTVAPEAPYGRRQGTPEEIARINALLEERFPTTTTAEAEPVETPAPSEAPAPAPIAAGETSAAG